MELHWKIRLKLGQFLKIGTNLVLWMAIHKITLSTFIRAKLTKLNFEKQYLFVFLFEYEVREGVGGTLPGKFGVF